MTFGLDDGHEVAFCDLRRFGTGALALGPEGRDAFFAARLGGELTGAALRRLARGRRAPVKAFLLHQRRRGVGNIYADEATLQAAPRYSANALSRRPSQPPAYPKRAAWAAGCRGQPSAGPRSVAASRASVPEPVPPVLRDAVGPWRPRGFFQLRARHRRTTLQVWGFTTVPARASAPV